MNSRLPAARHRARRRFLCGLALLLLFLPALARAASDDQREIAALYRRALAGDKAAVEQCLARLEQILEAEPANPLARVYLGSTLTLRSRDMSFGPKKLSTLRRGVAIMDEAVAAAPRDPKVRLTRALTTDALPALLGYRAASRRDFAWLAQMARAHPERFSPDDLRTITQHQPAPGPQE